MFDLFKKKDYVASVPAHGRAITVRGGDKLLDAALEAGLDWPHDCRVGSCGTCRCVLLSGKTKALTDFSYTLDPAEIERGVILACQTQLRSDVELEVELGDSVIAVQRMGGRISRTAQLTHDIMEVEVALDTAAFAGAQAGQYVELSRDGLAAPRSYSFARRPTPGGSETLLFAIRHVPGGEFTDWLFGAERSGAELEISGPFGQFYLRAQTGRMLCIAGGSGLAPIVALLEQGVADHRTDPCTVLFGARTQADLYYLARLTELGRQWRGSFDLVPVLNEEPEGSDWRGARGLVTAELAALAAAGFADDQAYLCGPPPMVDAGIAELVRLGMNKQAIYFDKFLDASTQPGGRAAVASHTALQSGA